MSGALALPSEWGNWRGILETRPSGMLMIPYDRRSFDVATLDPVINNVGQLYQLAVGA